MKIWIYVFLVIMAIVLTAGCGGGPGTGATLTGRVVNGATDTPLGGVRLAVGSATATSKSDGSFILNNVPTGVHTLSAQMDGYEISTMSVTINTGSNNPVSVLMAPVSGDPPPPPF